MPNDRLAAYSFWELGNISKIDIAALLGILGVVSEATLQFINLDFYVRIAVIGVALLVGLWRLATLGAAWISPRRDFSGFERPQQRRLWTMLGLLILSTVVACWLATAVVDATSLRIHPTGNAGVSILAPYRPISRLEITLPSGAGCGPVSLNANDPPSVTIETDGGIERLVVNKFGNGQQLGLQCDSPAEFNHSRFASFPPTQSSAVLIGREVGELKCRIWIAGGVLCGFSIGLLFWLLARRRPYA